MILKRTTTALLLASFTVVAFGCTQKPVDPALSAANPEEDPDLTRAELAAPGNLRSPSSTSTSVTLAWNGVPNAAGYRLWRRDTAINVWEAIAEVGASSLTYTDTAVSAGKSLRYTVRALDAQDRAGPPSNYLNVTVPSATGGDNCQKTTCIEQEATCGALSDDCGGTLHCGTCTVAGETCGGGGIANRCGANNCTPKTCAAQGFDCGSASNGCGGTLDCGTCTVEGQTCGGGGMANVCGTPVAIAGATPPNYKVAFIGDTASSTNFENVLKLVDAEGAELLIIEGDMDYSSTPSAWISTLNRVMGTSFPVLMAKGNHDDKWTSGYTAELTKRIQANNIVTDSPDYNDQHYHTVYKGLSLVFIGDNSLSTYPTYIKSKLGGTNNIWKICNWHKNQAAMQIGGKGDEMGWEVYEACREMGALIMTGHEHSYERTKTLISTSNQTVDPTCSDGANICLAKGKTMVTVTGLGGNGIRDQNRCSDGCKGEWASIYTLNQNATFGAQFITFYVDGNPKKARGYFKNIKGETVDTFTITAQ